MSKSKNSRCVSTYKNQTNTNTGVPKRAFKASTSFHVILSTTAHQITALRSISSRSCFYVTCTWDTTCRVRLVKSASNLNTCVCVGSDSAVDHIQLNVHIFNVWSIQYGAYFIVINLTCFHSAFVHLFFSTENKNAAEVNCIIYPQFASTESVYYYLLVSYCCIIVIRNLMQKRVLSVFSTMINCIWRDQISLLKLLTLPQQTPNVLLINN